LTKPLPSIANLLAISDDGSVSEGGTTFRQISYLTNVAGNDTTNAEMLTGATRVRVMYDPQTLLPSSIEYAIHADNNLNTSLKVRVVYSDYQVVSGLPIPFRIDRYVNNSLQLSISVTNSSIQ
jgi:hypothetical protein